MAKNSPDRSKAALFFSSAIARPLPSSTYQAAGASVDRAGRRIRGASSSSGSPFSMASYHEFSALGLQPSRALAASMRPSARDWPGKMLPSTAHARIVRRVDLDHFPQPITGEDALFLARSSSRSIASAWDPSRFEKSGTD